MNTTNKEEEMITLAPRDTASSVLARIKAEHLTPTPRYAFMVRECGIWTFWGFSVLVGALALAVTVYDGLSATYALYEATHVNFWTFLVDVLPYVWLITFVLMTMVAVQGLRATKHGYRYPTFVILGSSIVCSLAGGVLFHEMGFGYVLDTVLGRQVAPYMSMEKMELGRWQSPSEGRLVGMLVSTDMTDIATTTLMIVQFQDITGQIWTLRSGNLRERDLLLLQSQNRVRLLGTTTSPYTFHICGVFPWMYERAMARSEMQREREAFIEAVEFHQKTIQIPPPMPPADEMAEDQLCWEVLARIQRTH